LSAITFSATGGSPTIKCLDLKSDKPTNPIYTP
jgi:hypothetical protein